MFSDILFMQIFSILFSVYVLRTLNLLQKHKKQQNISFTEKILIKKDLFKLLMTRVSPK